MKRRVIYDFAIRCSNASELGLGGRRALNLFRSEWWREGKVALIKALMRPVNLILLDEPTNHLDMPSKAILEQSLLDYDGTLVVISHDRQLLNQICTEIWAVADGHVGRYLGNYEDYLQKVKRTAAFGGPRAVFSDSASPDARQGNQKARRRAEAEKRKTQQKLLKPLRDEMKRLESQLLDIESSIETLEAEQLTPGHYDDVNRVVEVARLNASHQSKKEHH